MNFRLFKDPERAPKAKPNVEEFMPSLCRSGSPEESLEGQQQLWVAVFLFKCLVTLNTETSINALILRNKVAFCV